MGRGGGGVVGGGGGGESGFHLHQLSSLCVCVCVFDLAFPFSFLIVLHIVLRHFYVFFRTPSHTTLTHVLCCRVCARVYVRFPPFHPVCPVSTLSPSLRAVKYPRGALGSWLDEDTGADLFMACAMGFGVTESAMRELEVEHRRSSTMSIAATARV